MPDVLDLAISEPATQKLIVIGFTDQFEEMPLFFGSTLLMIDREQCLMNTWNWSKADPLKSPLSTDYQLDSQTKYSEASLHSAVEDSDFVALLTNEGNPDVIVLEKWLSHLTVERAPELTLLTSWPDTANPNQTELPFFDCHLHSQDKQCAVNDIRAVAEVLTNRFLVGFDFADLRTVMTCMSHTTAFSVRAKASGTMRAALAFQSAWQQIGIPPESIYVAIRAGRDIRLDEFGAIADLIDQSINESSTCSIGVIYCPQLEKAGELEVTIIVISGSSVQLPSRTIADRLNIGPLEIPIFLRKQITDKENR